MVGGGRGAFIGGVHRRAAGLDGQIELVAGAFSSDPKKSALSGKDFFIDPSRVYASYKESILFRLWCAIICTSKWLRPFLRQESM
jgi:hypothetical protein